MVNTDPLRRFVVRLFWLRPFTVPHTNPDSSISHIYLKASVPDGNVGSEEKAESQGIVSMNQAGPSPWASGAQLLLHLQSIGTKGSGSKD